MKGRSSGMDRGLIHDGIVQVLLGLGLDLKDPNFKGTPGRAYQEIFAGLVGDVDFQVQEILSSTFPCEHQQMIVARQIEVFSMCPHHLLPVRYMITVGYLPGRGSEAKVLGISKLARIVELFAARPSLQEQMVNDITDALMKIPGCAGAGCIAHGEHFCMRMRGVKQSQSVVITNSLRGGFLEDEKMRSEFMDLAH
jgi:GTP cyclohydrolase IA